MNQPTLLLYTSLVRPQRDEALLALVVHECILWTDANVLGGAVLLHEGRLLQALEGPEPAVQGCFDRLADDGRHEQVTLLTMGPAATRRFEPGMMRLAQVHPGLAQAVREVVEQLVRRPDAVNTESALRLLRTLAPGG